MPVLLQVCRFPVLMLSLDFLSGQMVKFPLFLQTSSPLVPWNSMTSPRLCFLDTGTLFFFFPPPSAKLGMGVFKVNLDDQVY